MAEMIAGFVTNIALDYAFVWVLEQGVSGAAWATVIVCRRFSSGRS